MAAAAAITPSKFDPQVLEAAEKTCGLPYPVWAAAQRVGIKTHWWQLWKRPAAEVDDAVEGCLAAMKPAAVLKAAQARVSPPNIFFMP